MADRAPLHPISRRHLDALTGPLGVMQHAIGSAPDPAHGYCVDDVARALQVDVVHGQLLGWPTVAESASRNLRFLEAAYDESAHRFRNFRDMSSAWSTDTPSQDSQGRAMFALGEAIAGAGDPELIDAAQDLFGRALPAAARLTSPRARASVVLGCAAVAGSDAIATAAATRRAAQPPGRRTAADRSLGEAADAAMRDLATGLQAQFLWRAEPGWPWLEDSLTYENALVPRALVVAGRQLGANAMQAIGLQVIDWLFSIQTATAGHLSPVGNQWWPRGGERSRFDQQPIEATALLLAASAAHAATGETRYVDAAERAYGWFLGRNDLHLALADTARGASADGLTATGRNTNEGAESTLMWLTAAANIRTMRAAAG